MKTRKILALILSLCMVAALLAGCNNSSSDSGTAGNGNNDPAPATTPAGNEGGNTESGPAATGTYLRDKIAVSCYMDGGTLDPWAMAGWGNANSTSLIFQHLANIDSDGVLYYEIAKSFEKVDDTTYTLTIWDSIVDTDGNAITADDIIWSFEQYIDAGNQGGINRFDHFEKVDDYTLTWVCNAPFSLGEMEKNLTNPPIVCQKTYEDHNSDMTTTPVGSGPYKLKDYTPGSSFTLEANEDFWMNDLGIELSKWEVQNVKEIEYQIIQDASSRAIALEMGTIDIADSLDAADVDAFAGNPDISPVLMPQDPPVAFIFNCSDNSPCGDVNLRQAICYGLNNAAIAEALAVPAYEVYAIGPRMWDAPSSWMDGRDYYNYDPAKAQELLDASSYNGETLYLQYASSSSNDGAAIMIQSQLKDLNINVELRCLEESVRQIEQFDDTKWDFRMDIFGGGNYLSQVLKRFSSADASAHLDGDRTIMMVPDAKLDELWNAILDDPTSQENIVAWEDYFTFEQCYAYGICCYSNQTCCRSDVNAVTAGTRNLIAPNACTFN